MDLPQNLTPNDDPVASIDAQTWYVDTNFMGAAHYIATGVLDLPGGGLALVDPGPATVLEGLKAGLEAGGASLEDVKAVLLTHIHLDHAGATGTIAAECPSAEVYVHRVGAPHVADPSRLLKSARRLYGDQMDVLWGEVRPVPEARVHAVEDGDVVALGTGAEPRRVRVAYTPGHASHQVGYLDEASGTAFVGDTAGQRTAGVGYVWPVTPPPDVDLDAWQDSLDALRAWDADRLFCTHFGPHDDPAAHLDQMSERLRRWGEDARALLADDQYEDDEARAAAFDEENIAAMRAAVAEEDRTPYESFGRPRESFYGLARYWRKREDE